MSILFDSAFIEIKCFIKLIKLEYVALKTNEYAELSKNIVIVILLSIISDIAFVISIYYLRLHFLYKF